MTETISTKLGIKRGLSLVFHKDIFFSAEEKSFFSAYPCETKGASVSGILLTDKSYPLINRSFLVGNAHPDYKGFSCQSEAIEMLFNEIAKRHGIPSNAIITGDFNVGFNSPTPEGIMLRSISSKYGFKRIYSTTYHPGLLGNIDHVFSSFEWNMTSECEKVDLDEGYFLNEPDIWHHGILCDVYQSN